MSKILHNYIIKWSSVVLLAMPWRGFSIRKLTVIALVFLLFISSVPNIVFAQTDPADQSTISEPVSDNKTVLLPEAEEEIPTNEGDKDSTLKEDAENTNNLSDETENDKSAAPETDPNTPQDKRSDTLKKVTPKVDESSGSLLYTVPFVVPPGRNNVQPDIALQYNSQGPEDGSSVGYGWSLNVPYIERINRTGGERLYSELVFNSSLSGELVSGANNQFLSKVDNGDFLAYTYINNYWTVKDKKGTTYVFGNSTQSKQDDPSDSSRVYKWMLQEVTDANGNKISYTYHKEDNQLYPTTISYGHRGSESPLFAIDFIRENRPDIIVSYKPTFSVTTRYRIKEVVIKVSGDWVRKYQLNYQLGDNGRRSMLQSVVESGKSAENAVTTLPAITFEYQTATYAGDPWQSDSTHPFPVDIRRSQIADVNGDSLPDILYSYQPFQGQEDRRTYLNDGNGGWLLSQSYEPPILFYQDVNESNVRDRGVRLVDVNGDGLTDILYHNSGAEKTWLNTDNGWQEQNKMWISPLAFAHGNGGNNVEDFYAHIADINCDGLPDIIRANQAVFNPNQINSFVYLNNGVDGWTQSNQWTSPVDMRWGTDLVDLNGDGCADILQSFNSENQPDRRNAYLSNGKNGWVTYSELTPPFIFYQNPPTFPNDLGARLIDFNGDGLVDIARRASCVAAPPELGYLHQNNSWNDQTSIWTAPLEFTLCNSSVDTGTRVVDINADGMQDVIQATGSNTFIRKNNRKKADLLSKITTSTGGVIEVTYKSTAQVRQGANVSNPNLPMTIMVVDNMLTISGSSPAIQSSYMYEQGYYYYATPHDRKFGGFNVITVTDSAGNKKITYYHQGNNTDTAQGELSDHISKLGKPYRIETRGNSNALYTVTINQWDRIDRGNDANFVSLTQTTTLQYDGNDTHADTAETYQYNASTGNQIRTTKYGQVQAQNDGSFTDAGTDMFITNVLYATGSTNGVSGLPSKQTVLDYAGNRVSETKFYYDNLPQGSVEIGNDTQQDRWLTGSNYSITRKVFNQYGLPVEVYDGQNNRTQYQYDAQYLYPTRVTNALNQVTQFTYDYSSGNIVTTIDPNGAIANIVYDGLDRPLQEFQSDHINYGNQALKTVYVYSDIPAQTSVRRTDYLDASVAIDTYSYFDGLGRLSQERKSAEVPGQFIAHDYVYNNRGLVEKNRYRTLVLGGARTSPTSITALYIVYTHDPLNRIITTANAMGTTATVFDDWQQRTTDANGNLKVLYTDAYGQLFRVDEHNAGIVHTTTYAYNGNGLLTNITDALGNVRNIQYDGVGQRTQVEDLHAPLDTTFGIWIYQYDNTGNLISRIDGNGQRVEFHYDGLNRITLEDWDGSLAQDIVTTYDTCLNGIGRVCTVSKEGFQQNFEYDILGRNIKDSKTLSSQLLETRFEYDRQANIVRVVNPDNSEIKYEYNPMGMQERILRKESTDSGFSPYIVNLNYAPTGGLAYQEFASGARSTNTYDADHLYRLSRKLTTLPLAGGQVRTVQDSAYQYDAIGNITRIADTNELNTRKTVTYTYDDLYRLVNARTTHATSGQNYVQNYSYDAIGNIIYKSDSGTYSYNGNTGNSYANPHALTSISQAGTVVATYVYDRNGNVQSVGGTTYQWDYNNRLISVTPPGIIAAPSSYVYDVAGTRVQVTTFSSTVLYPSKYYNVPLTANGAVGIDTNDADKKDDNNVTLGSPTKHIYAESAVVGTIQGTGAGAVALDVHTDHLGSTKVVSSSSGTVQETVDYYPFGSVSFNSAPGGQPEQRKYTGHEYDVDTGLNYANARYYNTAIGRFISQDPVFLAVGNNAELEQRTEMKLIEYLSDPQNFNSYSYVKNNPLVAVDPNGEWVQYIIGEKNAVKLGNWAQRQYDNNSVARYAMDHPYQAGAAIGVAGGALVVGGVVATGGAITCGVLCGGSAATIATGGAALSTQANKATSLLNSAQTTILNATQRQSIANTIQNPTLRNIFNSLYKGSDKLPGGTAGAIRYEQATGNLLSPNGHLYKGQTTINGLNKILQNPNVSQGDKAIAQTLFNQLSNAINGK